ncbi:hypothetical protein HPB50_025293 [Hyalomma asiaticum]|uniref:Uncharacterized protein n=1 Tax=Hyalomma asiaticum TaxID=266040 RepID=A0ACB7RZY4_HYAAI|nr:hypothetical protein HPB50_025293 [Hyalomma asiaticum]
MAQASAATTTQEPASTACNHAVASCLPCCRGNINGNLDCRLAVSVASFPEAVKNKSDQNGGAQGPQGIACTLNFGELFRNTGFSFAATMESRCSCKGVRTCLFCEQVKEPSKHAISKRKVRHPFTFCPHCRLCWPGWINESVNESTESTQYNNRDRYVPPLKVPGIEVYEDFLTREEESDLVDGIDSREWVGSQSGRLKQDFGPRVNFKKKRVKAAEFAGLPAYFTNVERKMSRCAVVSDFEAVELCNLDYSPKRGSCIDPHYDDWWLWGHRLVTFNLLSDTVLTLSRPEQHWMLTDEDLIDEPSPPAADCCPQRPTVVHDRNVCKSWSEDFKDSVALPRRSMLVLYGDARYKWHHSILREDVSSRRVAMTVRELSEEFLEGGASCDFGAELLEIAKLRVQHKLLLLALEPVSPLLSACKQGYFCLNSPSQMRGGTSAAPTKTTKAGCCCARRRGYRRKLPSALRQARRAAGSPAEVKSVAANRLSTRGAVGKPALPRCFHRTAAATTSPRSSVGEGRPNDRPQRSLAVFGRAFHVLAAKRWTTCCWLREASVTDKFSVSC